MEEVFFNPEEDKPEDEISNTTFFVGLLIIVVSVIFFVDSIGSGSLRNNLFLKPLCGYELPSNMQIVTNGKKYVVAVEKGSQLTSYLCDDGLGKIYSWLAVISKPTMLNTECKARALAKKYMMQQKIKYRWDDSEFK
jgi:hypothetical protein